MKQHEDCAAVVWPSQGIFNTWWTGLQGGQHDMYSHRVVATILQAKDFANFAAKMGHVEKLVCDVTVSTWFLRFPSEVFRLPSKPTDFFFKFRSYNSLTAATLMIDWLIDWIVFYTVSAIFQPYNSGDYWFQVIGFIVSLAAPTSLLFYEIHWIGHCLPRGL